MYKILFLTFFISGCVNQAPNTFVDVCLQKEYFEDCMKDLPTGPTSTKYNDWSEVISECRDTARELSYRQTKNIKEECKGGFAYQ